ncbi:lebercilin-like protein isoform X3 [Osmerus eperlanus]
MSVRRLSKVQQEEAQCKEGAGDADSCNNSTSDRCSPLRSSQEYSSREGSEGSLSQCEYEDYEDKTVTPSTLKKKGLKTSKPQTQNKRGQHFFKRTHKASRKAPMFPPIKPQDGLKQRIRSAHTHRIKELTNQVWALQQQLAGAATENRLLRQLQGRHTAALQRFQDAQSDLPQVLQNHSCETRSLQELLRKARMRRNSFARRLRATEDELLRTGDALRRLRLLSQDQSLGERNELTQRLALATADLEGKTRRMQDLERNLELSHASFNRQIASEMRKTNEARQLSEYLKEQICQLTQKIKERERELEINNIYSHRFPKGLNGKCLKESKLVQTDAVSALPIEAPAYPLELEYPNTDPQLEKHTSLVNWTPLAIDHTVPEEEVAEKSGEDEWPQDNKEGSDEPEDGLSSEDGCPREDGYLAVEEATSTQDLEREQPKPSDNQVHFTLEHFLQTENLPNKDLKSPSRIRRHYTFKETTLNLHSGKPAYSTHTPSLRRSPPQVIKSQARVDNLGSGAYEPSFVTLPTGTGLRRVSPQTEEVGLHSKKSSLMKELFGPGQITDLLPVQRGRSRGQGSGLDRLSTYHTGEPHLTWQRDQHHL